MVFGFPVFVFAGFRFRLHIKFNDNQYMLATSASSSHDRYAHERENNVIAAGSLIGGVFRSM